MPSGVGAPTGRAQSALPPWAQRGRQDPGSWRGPSPHAGFHTTCTWGHSPPGPLAWGCPQPAESHNRATRLLPGSRTGYWNQVLCFGEWRCSAGTATIYTRHGAPHPLSQPFQHLRLGNLLHQGKPRPIASSPLGLAGLTFPPGLEVPSTSPRGAPGQPVTRTRRANWPQGPQIRAVRAMRRAPTPVPGP